MAEPDTTSTLDRQPASNHSGLQQPYVGLRPYEAPERTLFFGRDRDQQLLQNKIYSAALTVLYAPSGVGKTSLLKTLIIPDICARNDRVIYIDQWPRGDPAPALRAAILAVTLSEQGPSVEQPTDQPLADLIRAQAASTPNASVVIILDQFEQVLLHCESVGPLSGELGVLVRSHLKVHVVISLREEFLARLQAFRADIVTLYNSVYRLDYLSGDKARRAITGPGEVFPVKFTFTPDLVDALLEDLKLGSASAGAADETVHADGIDLPIMQIVCDRLWHASDGHEITFDRYKTLGRRDGIITSYIEEITADLSPERKEEAAQILDLLAPTTQSGLKMAYPADILQKNTGLPQERIDAMLKHWEKQHVVRMRAIGDAVTYELYHDAFIKVLRPWIDTQNEQKRKRLEAIEQAKFREEQRIELEKERRQARRLRTRATIAWITAGLAVIALASGYMFFRSAQRESARAEDALTLAVINDQANSNPTIASLALRELLQKPDYDRLALASMLRLARAQLYRVTLANSGVVTADNFDPSGQLIITLPADDNTARISNGDGKLLAELKGHNGPISRAAFSPTEPRVVTASALDGTVRLWDLQGKQLAALPGSPDPLAYATFSPDGKLIAVILNGAKLWDFQGNVTRELKGDVGPVRYLSFSPDGQRIVGIAFDDMVRLWDRNGDPVPPLTGHTKPVTSVTFSPDGQTILSTSFDGTARLWDRDGKSIELTGHKSDVWHGAFSPKGDLIATGSSDTSVRLWDLKGHPLGELKRHAGPVRYVAFNSDGKTFVSASLDNSARVWDTEGNSLAVLRGHSAPVTYAGFFGKTQTMVTASSDGTLRLWDHTEEHKPIKHGAPVTYGAFSPDGKTVVTTSFNGSVLVSNRRGAQTASLEGDLVPVWHAAYSPNSQTIVTSSNDGTARLWSRDGMLIRELTGHTQGVWQAEFSPDGKAIVTSSEDGTAMLWDAEGNARRPLEGHGAAVKYSSFSHDGATIVTASFDRTSRLWDRQGKLVRTLAGHSQPVTYAAFSPDDQTIVTTSIDGTARLWDRNSEAFVTLAGHLAPVTFAAFSPDGTRVVTSSGDKTARVWDRKGKEVGQLQGHTQAVSFVAFSEDGKLIVTASDDSTARVWASDEFKQPIVVFREHFGPVRSANFSRNGRSILTASADGTARIWDLDSQAFSERVRTGAAPCFTAEERSIFFRHETPKEARQRICVDVKAAPSHP